MAAQKTWATALCLLPALMCVGISAEPLCNTSTDGDDAACAQPLGQSVLQRTSDVREQSLSIAETEEETSLEGCWWQWRSGTGIGGYKRLGSAQFLYQCQRQCQRDSEHDRTVTGCIWERRTTCFAVRGMYRIHNDNNGQSVYIPCAKPCSRRWSWYLGAGDGNSMQSPAAEGGVGMWALVMAAASRIMARPQTSMSVR
uniref:Apple domain-containing protein n=1 Tax=Alexandrium monilatum TaxID=311494 RepID=A0A7S4WJJ1_9DINO